MEKLGREGPTLAAQLLYSVGKVRWSACRKIPVVLALLLGVEEARHMRC